MFEPYCRLYDRLTLDGCNCQVSLVHIVHKLWAHQFLPVEGLFVFDWKAEKSPMFWLGNLVDRFTSIYPTSHDMWQVPLKFFGVCKPRPLIKDELSSSLSLALSISHFLNLFLSLRDRDRADTIITFHHHHPPTTNFLRTLKSWLIRKCDTSSYFCTENLGLIGVAIHLPCLQ